MTIVFYKTRRSQKNNQNESLLEKTACVLWFAESKSLTHKTSERNTRGIREQEREFINVSSIPGPWIEHCHSILILM